MAENVILKLFSSRSIVHFILFFRPVLKKHVNKLKSTLLIPRFQDDVFCVCWYITIFERNLFLGTMTSIFFISLAALFEILSIPVNFIFYFSRDTGSRGGNNFVTSLC